MHKEVNDQITSRLEYQAIWSGAWRRATARAQTGTSRQDEEEPGERSEDVDVDAWSWTVHVRAQHTPNIHAHTLSPTHMVHSEHHTRHRLLCNNKCIGGGCDICYLTQTFSWETAVFICIVQHTYDMCDEKTDDA